MWKRNDIKFHQPVISSLLQQYLPQLHLNTNDSILVPLCGKSLDMDLLADSGYHVMGVEVSNIAIQAYFDARGVKPRKEKKEKFIRWWHQNIEIWCGDIFNLTANDIGHIRTLYDCAALTAFPADSRPYYVRHFHENLSPHSQILLITVETADGQQQDSSSTIDREVQALYEKHYRIDLLHGQRSFKQDPEDPGGPNRTMEEKVYLLTNSTSAYLGEKNNKNRSG
jgi:thiopurine S-methyltransferase